VGQALGRFIEGSQDIQAPHGKRPRDGDGLELLGWHMDLSSKVLAPLVGPHDLSHDVNRRRSVKTLLKSHSNHAH
jgi:hypothetical protein